MDAVLKPLRVRLTRLSGQVKGTPTTGANINREQKATVIQFEDDIAVIRYSEAIEIADFLSLEIELTARYRATGFESEESVLQWFQEYDPLVLQTSTYLTGLLTDKMTGIPLVMPPLYKEKQGKKKGTKRKSG